MDNREERRNGSSRQVLVSLLAIVIGALVLAAAPAFAHHKVKCTYTGVIYGKNGTAISAMTCSPVAHKPKPEGPKVKPSAVEKPKKAPASNAKDGPPSVNMKRMELLDFYPVLDLNTGSNKTRDNGFRLADAGLLLGGGLGLIWVGRRRVKRDRSTQAVSRIGG